MNNKEIKKQRNKYLILTLIFALISISIVIIGLSYKINNIYVYILTLIMFILAFYFSEKHGKALNKLYDKRNEIKVLRQKHYLYLFAEAVKQHHIGKAEYMYIHFLNNSVFDDVCKGVLIGMRCVSKVKTEREHGFFDLKELYD